MCGCNSNVTFAKGAVQETAQFVVPAPKRKLTTSCDTVGKCGIVERNEFTVSEGPVVTFGRNRSGLGTNFPKDNFSVTINASYVSSIGLRQIAEECASMADELDGQKTVVSMANMPKSTSKKAKSKKGKK